RRRGAGEFQASRRPDRRVRAASHADVQGRQARAPRAVRGHLMDTALVERIHASGRRIVVAVSGGGSGVIAALLRVPGASRPLVEAVVPYAFEALVDFLGRPPEPACSPDTAAAMAVRARERAAALVGATGAALVGLGVTASLASDRPKRGDHRGHLAV